MQRHLPQIAGAALCAVLLSSCATPSPNGAVVSLYREAMVAAARPPTRLADKPMSQADRATRAVAAWREGAASASAPESAGQLE